MRRLAGRTVFSVGKHEFRWEDVVIAAYLWDEMPVLERSIAQKLAAEKHLADVGQAVFDEEVESAADVWRYERDLISGDDTESWMTTHELDVDEWLNYFRRSESVKRCADRSKAIAKTHRPSPDEIEAVLYSEALCSGTIRDLTNKLAARAAIYDRVTGDGSDRHVPKKAELRTLLDRLPGAVRQRGLFALRGSDCVKRAEYLARMSLAFDRFVDTLAAPARLEREIEAHALEWTHLDCKTLTFSAEEPAREAALLMREDGLPITKAAAIAKSKVLAAHYVLEDVDPPLKDRLVGAQPGDLVGPIHMNDGFLVVSVRDRVEPSGDDPLIRERARDRMVRRTVQAEIDKRIRWRERF